MSCELCRVGDAQSVDLRDAIARHRSLAANAGQHFIGVGEFRALDQTARDAQLWPGLRALVG